MKTKQYTLTVGLSSPGAPSFAPFAFVHRWGLVVGHTAVLAAVVVVLGLVPHTAVAVLLAEVVPLVPLFGSLGFLYRF